MDYNKLIDDLRWWAEQCDRTNHGCQARRILSDAATALSTLQAENERLRTDLEQVKRERETAVADLEHLMLVVNSGECCTMCKHDHEHLTGPCAGQSTRCKPEWRGPKKGY